MFYSDTEISVVKEQHLERLRKIAQQRLIREIQHTNQQRAGQNAVGWIVKLLRRSSPKHPKPLDQNKVQAI